MIGFLEWRGAKGGGGYSTRRGCCGWSSGTRWGNTIMANAVQMMGSISGATLISKKRSDQTMVHALSNDQWGTLLSILNFHNKNHQKMICYGSSTHWITSEHLTI